MWIPTVIGLLNVCILKQNPKKLPSYPRTQHSPCPLSQVTTIGGDTPPSITGARRRHLRLARGRAKSVCLRVHCLGLYVCTFCLCQWRLVRVVLAGALSMNSWVSPQLSLRMALYRLVIGWHRVLQAIWRGACLCDVHCTAQIGSPLDSVSCAIICHWPSGGVHYLNVRLGNTILLLRSHARYAYICVYIYLYTYIYIYYLYV